MHPYFIVTFAAVIFLLGVVWVIVRENRRQKERHLREFGEQYGRIFDHMYSHAVSYTHLTLPTTPYV